MKKPILVALFFVIFTSCYYSSDEVFFMDIPGGDLPHVEISTNLDTMDSVIIEDSLYFEYAVSIDTGKFYLTRIYFDEFYIYVSDSIQNNFWINPEYLPENGHYDLLMRVYYQTMSGSLADQIDAEFEVLDSTWVVTINRQVPQ